MATINRIRVSWSGSAVIGPAVSTFYFLDDDDGAVARLGDFFDSIKVQFPTAVAWQCPGAGDQLDVESGEVVGAWTMDGGWVNQGTSPNSWIMGVGARIRWETGGFTNGRRVRGATFLVPLNIGALAGISQVDNAVVTDVNDKIATFVNANTIHHLIYTPPKGSSAGKTAQVVSGHLVDAISTLRSRRT